MSRLTPSQSGGLPTITLSEYEAIPPDFRGVWDTERHDLKDWPEIRHKYIGKRTMLDYYNNGTAMLIEGLSFEIVEEK